MDSININIEDSSLQPFVQRMLKWLKAQPEIDVVQDGDNLRLEPSKDKNYMIPGPPMTWEELNAQLEEAQRDYEAGHYWTTEELRNDLKNW